MNDWPSAPEVLDAVAQALTDEVLAGTAGGTAHTVRVAANLCRIVARQIRADDGSAVDLELALLVGLDEATSPDDLGAALDERLRTDDPAFDAAAAELLLADVVRRVDIAKPGYRGASE